MDDKSTEVVVGDAVRANRFGKVTDTSVEFNVKKGLFAGSSMETLPIRHVTSVRLETSRHWVWGIIFIILGLALLPVYGLGLVLLFFGVLFVWGSPKVVVNTAGGDLRPSVSWPWTTNEANTFTGWLRSELLKRG